MVVKTLAMTPSISTPPPSPATMPNAAVKKASAVKPTNMSGVTPATLASRSSTRELQKIVAEIPRLGGRQIYHAGGDFAEPFPGGADAV